MMNTARLGLRHIGERLTPRLIVIGTISFLTLIDLFATQAILPSLASRYRVSPAEAGLAVNACTLGMAVSALLVAVFGNMIDRRRAIWLCLALLSIPTALLAIAPDLTSFAALRILQGLCMSAAFAFTIAFIAEHGSPEETAAGLAAYVTGNVASNLLGRMAAAALADHAGLPITFFAFAALNLLGAVLVIYFLDGMMDEPAAATGARATGSIGAAARNVPMVRASRFAPVLMHLANAEIMRVCAIGFLILFAFLGIFTYVNFVLVAPPLALSAATLGFVYLVFIPATATTPRSAQLQSYLGLRWALIVSLAAAIAGLPMLLSTELWLVLAGLALIGAGTFAAQALATSALAQLTMTDRPAASGLYLASYYAGGLVGSAAVGQIYMAGGWPIAVGTVGLALVGAAVLAATIRRGAAESS